MDAIRENEADYLLTVKKGNPLTCQETEELFAELKKEQEQLTEHPEKAAACEKQLASYEVFKTSEKNRSRMEYRTMQICHDTELITLCRKQPEIKTVGIISSRNISAQEALEIKRKAVDDLSLHIWPGEIYGFIGHNGAGKTTTIKSCCGILQYDSGEVYVNGVSMKENPMVCKGKIAYLLDNPDLYEFMTGIQFLNFVADIFPWEPERGRNVSAGMRMHLN